MPSPRFPSLHDLCDPSIMLFGRMIPLAAAAANSSSSSTSPSSSVSASVPASASVSAPADRRSPVFVADFGSPSFVPAPGSAPSFVVNKNLDAVNLQPRDADLSPRGVHEVGISSFSNSGSDEEDTQGLGPEQGLETVDAAHSKRMLQTERQMEVQNSHLENDGTLRKPDKPVPCPRCDSLDTKFCYFNNYNVKQPRHFCRNCQRYWTAGGTLRNVPIGAGRRKNKHSATANQRQSHPEIVIPRRDHPDSAQLLHSGPISHAVGMNSGPGLHIPLMDAGCVIDSSPTSSSLSAFRQQMPFSGDLASGFQNYGMGALGGQSFPPQNDRGYASVDAEIHEDEELKAPEQDVQVGYNNTTVENDESTCCSSVTAAAPPSHEPVSDSNLDGGTSTPAAMVATGSAFANPGAWCGPALPFVWPWPYMYNNNVGWVGAAPTETNPMPAPLNGPPAWAGLPDNFFQWPPVPTPMWNPYGWSFPWNFAWNANAAAAAAAAAAANAGATTLGKRPRSPPEGTSEGSLCVPKTLRIHHPEEAARSSILTTLGVGNRPESLASGGGFFNAFQPKAEVFQPKPGVRTSEEPLDSRHANPAAQARSMAFQEGN